MAKSRAQKQEMVDGTHEVLAAAQTVVVAHYRGLTVSEMTTLRRKMHAAGAGFQVTKNKLTRRSLASTKFEGIAELFNGPTAMAYSADPVQAAKILVEFAKDNEKLVIVGGAFGDRRLDVKGVEQLAKMPSLNELRARIIGMLQTPATRIACVLQAPGGQVARVIAAHARKG